MKKRALKVRIVGGGLAGVEAAHLLASRGVGVDLFEMRPARFTPAHKTGLLGELVCSNSLKGTDPETAHGLLKKEMQALGSLVIETALKTRVPAGKALAVDREAFAENLTRRIESNELISLIREEVEDIDPEIPTIIASGPLTSDRLAARLSEMTGSSRLFFYDAISPIIDAGSIDYRMPGAGGPLSMPRDALAIKARLGVVSQFDTLDPDFNLAENLLVYGRYFGMKDAA
ncbi:MAG TPA: FAD-dependent oxidoreductase, partial [Deltaproteobacteria bacterium]|nr:FAD-dependent oxidoreductase [Deltaproteobacteria bacterium]